MLYFSTEFRKNNNLRNPGNLRMFDDNPRRIPGNWKHRQIVIYNNKIEISIELFYFVMNNLLTYV